MGFCRYDIIIYICHVSRKFELTLTLSILLETIIVLNSISNYYYRIIYYTSMLLYKVQIFYDNFIYKF